MANIAEVIGWKFDNQPGMRCQPDGREVLQIVEFPGGIPSQGEQDTWTSEFDARSATEVDQERVDQAFPETRDNPAVIYESLNDINNRIRTLEGLEVLGKDGFDNYLSNSLPRVATP